ncbi:helix-turn-helix domain-containing protein [Metabacillus iocasae]
MAPPKIDTQQHESKKPIVPLKNQMEAHEKQCIEQALKQSNGKVSQAAKLLGVSRQTLQYRIKRLEIKSKEVTTSSF